MRFGGHGGDLCLGGHWQVGGQLSLGLSWVVRWDVFFKCPKNTGPSIEAFTKSKVSIQCIYICLLELLNPNIYIIQIILFNIVDGYPIPYVLQGFISWSMPTTLGIVPWHFLGRFFVAVLWELVVIYCHEKMLWWKKSGCRKNINSIPIIMSSKFTRLLVCCIPWSWICLRRLFTLYHGKSQFFTTIWENMFYFF